ncbi:transmembrane protein 245 [Schistocerca serialis cubense]|uniref:transmembrane protein 245 n=1 Tax=Schistocerca serialis cubense TaxID=2023355 RepID=UPI00214E5E99|nr:transmembrane protein 245 [Schistocerca serialis cubense]
MSQNTSSAELITSPLDNVFSFLGGLPQGHEKALKQALYNALALFFLFVCCIAGVALFYVLEPFIKPLIWALLCGSVLHPFKYSLSTAMQGWIDSLSASSTPLIIGIVLAPIKIVDNLSEIIGDITVKYINYIVGFFASVSILLFVYYYTPSFMVCLILRLGFFASRAVSFITGLVNQYVVFAAIAGYIVMVKMSWKREIARQFCMMSYGVWLLVTCYVSGFAGPYRVAVFFTIVLLLLMGLAYQVISVHSAVKSRGRGVSIVEAMKLALENVTTEKVLEKAEREERVETDEPQLKAVEETVEELEEKTEDSKKESAEVKAEEMDMYSPNREQEHVRFSKVSDVNNMRMLRYLRRLQFRESHPLHMQEQKKPFITSQTYLCLLAWACSALIVWRYISFFSIIIPPLFVIYLVKRLGHYFGVWAILKDNIYILYSSVENWCTERLNALFPAPVIGLYKIFLRCNEKLVEAIKNLIDTAASITVILALIIFLCCTSVFLALQVYAEGINLVQIMGSAINNTLVKNSQLSELLPKDWEQQVDTLVDNAYVYGREGISKLVKGWLKDVEPQKEAQLESQFLELWDRTYQAWMSSGTEASFVGPTVSTGAITMSWESVMDSVHKVPELFNLSALFTFAKENVETLITLLESIWTILKGNVSLAFDSFTALFAVLFGGGTAVINFFVNLIVFFTALFYLLSSSGQEYKPVDLIRSFSPDNGSRFAVALEDAVGSVFKASFKMALFHGLWTWLIHNLFEVTVVYIPTVIATILGAVPFLGTYWASIPAIFDLWFNQGRQISAVLMLVCEMLVTSVVDSAIYQEITGTGHPYLTGLSVAGGIFLMGVEGAIVGPILLCGVFLAINMSSTLMNEASSSDTRLSEHLCHITDISSISHIRSKTQ